MITINNQPLIRYNRHRCAYCGTKHCRHEQLCPENVVECCVMLLGTVPGLRTAHRPDHKTRIGGPDLDARLQGRARNARSPLCDGTRRHFRRHANRTGRGCPRILMRLNTPAGKGEIARARIPRAQRWSMAARISNRDRGVLWQSSDRVMAHGRRLFGFSGRMRIRLRCEG